MFGFNKKEQNDDTDFLDLTEKVITLSAENKKLSDDLNAIVEGQAKLEDKYNSLVSTVRTMLAALRLAEQYVHANLGDQGKADNSVIRNAIAEGEKAL